MEEGTVSNSILEENSAATKKTGGGHTRCNYLNNLEDGTKIKVDIDLNFNQPTNNAELLVSYCGTLARDGGMFPIHKKSWYEVDKSSKMRAWVTILTKFEIDESLRGYIMKSFGKKWRDHKCRLKTKHYDTYADDCNRMPRCPPNRISAKNKKIRKRQILPHTSGLKSFARVRNEERMKSEMQATLDPVYMFVKTHVRKDGKPINTDAQTRIAKMQDFLQNPSLTSDGPTSQMEAFTNIMGPERPDRVQGLRLGLTPTRYFGSSSSHHSSSSELTTLRKELHEAKTQLAKTRATIDATIDEKVFERTVTIAAHMEERFEAKMQEFMKMVQTRL